ncbi:right-handed parallel beta-helix repeat-containing protein [Pseudonocardia spinosispora]|uniref:right-handed parallel beta-helix repeat-containing protein n=1 Tax=Pseudonocardia spinosispora TaxID=103441 RepID=UPI0012EBB4AD|nr:right-handed parallel beta-helix repeat-containing protein [Pseudonocardia spinosispora]
MPSAITRLSLVTLCAVTLAAGCSAAPEPVAPPPVTSAAPSPSPTPPPKPVPPPPPGAIRPIAAPTGCTSTVTVGTALRPTLAAATPGSTICLHGNLGARLSISRSGTAQAPIRVLGDGTTSVTGIGIEANYVTVSRVNVIRPPAPGVVLSGNTITLENSTVMSPQGDDGDGIRFWGSNIVIRHNTIAHTRNANHAHADCMQTFATDSDNPASQRILIDNNRCEDIDNNCLIVEGPNSEAGDGSGVGSTSNITYSNNYCANRAAQAVLIDDVSRVTLTNNEIVGADHAFALQNGTSGAKISGNKLHAGVQFEVGMDASSRTGYQGPPSGGPP